MIKGTVKRSSDGGLGAWVALFVMGVDGQLQQCDVIVDTGFTGWLTLPETDIRRLGLTRTGYRDGVTASGNTERFNYYQASVPWHGRPVRVEIFQSIDQPLPGMELMEGSRVAVDAWDGGDVTIREA